MRALPLVCRIGFIVLTLAAGPTFAQVYVWKDPKTGTTKMSNIRPPWYCSNFGVNGSPTHPLLDAVIF